LFDASKLPKRPLLETIKEMEPNSVFVCIELVELGDNLLAVLAVLRLCAYKRINLVSIKQGEIQLANTENLLIAIMEIQKNFIQTKE
jgi:DNA invertase Pin-like site-specific DNA recombinase